MNIMQPTSCPQAKYQKKSRLDIGDMVNLQADLQADPQADPQA